MPNSKKKKTKTKKKSRSSRDKALEKLWGLAEDIQDIVIGADIDAVSEADIYDVSETLAGVKWFLLDVTAAARRRRVRDAWS